jgi:hypothetical protein
LIAAGLILTIGAAGLPAAAAPLAPTSVMSDDSLIVPVRDGCGRGMRFSNSRQMCVADFGDRRDMRGDDRRGNFRDDGRRDNFRSECGRGMRFSNSRGRCVAIEGRRESDDGAVAAAVAVGVLGAVIGAAASNNDRKERRIEGRRNRP